MPLIAWTNSSEIMRQYSWNRTQGWGRDVQSGSVEHPVPSAMASELRQYYRAAVTHTDTLIGKLLEAVETFVPAPVRANLIVALWGDHGWHLGEQGMWGKCTDFEVATRAPMLIRAPGVTDGGVVSRQLTEHLDLMPTLAELALGIDVPRSPQPPSEPLKNRTSNRDPNLTRDPFPYF